MVHSSYLKGEEPRQILEKRMREEGRLPPGQSASLKWPVLHVGADPVFDATTWHFKAGGLVEAPLTLNWTQMTALPRVESCPAPAHLSRFCAKQRLPSWGM